MTAPAFAPARGRQPSIEWVPIADLLIDDSYQRSIETRTSQNLIRSIAAGWDWDVLDVLKVSRRPDDRLFVVDGQHRKAAAALRGDITQLPCVLKRCSGPTDEARLFIASNRGRKAMSRLDDFRAAVGAGDALSVEIEQLVTAAGLTIARVQASQPARGELAIVAPIARAMKLRGPEVVGQALQLLGLAFGHEPIVGASPLFGALVLLVALTDHEPTAILDTLRTGTSIDWVERSAAPIGVGGENRVIAMRAAIEARIASETIRPASKSPERASKSLTAAAPPGASPASPPARQPASPPAGGGKRVRSFEEQLAAVRAGARIVTEPPMPSRIPGAVLGASSLV